MGEQSGVSPEVLPLPKGGGAFRSIGETFSPDLHTGTGSYQIPLRLPQGPGGFQPDMSLVHSSGGGNGPFGMGWLLPVLQLARKTDRGLPRHVDEADTFVLDRQELIPLGGGRYRHCKEEQFRRVERSGDGWEVRDRSGRRFILGTTPQARIQDSSGGTTRVHAWMLERAIDRNGNEIHYEYLRDGNQLYLRTVRYGLYSATFVYEPRTDVFSDRRAGFDITTGLRCSSIELRLEGDPAPLFRRHTLAYDECPYTGISLLTAVTLAGLRQGPGELESTPLPVLRFQYTPFEPGHRYVAFSSQTGDPPPDSLENRDFDLVDLYGTALPGVIQLTGAVRRFWPNLGNGQWGPPRTLRQLPSTVALGSEAVAFADMNGDGAADLVSLEAQPLGYYRNEPGLGFQDKARFRHAPAFDPSDPQLRFVDLDGDGVVDAIRTAQHAFYVYYNRGDAGWDEPVAIPRVHDLERFPDVFFGDPRVQLADMSGDGLTDIVWVHGGALDWWPHYGNGRFGKRITLALQPTLGPRFDPARLFLSDINGDGVADLVYVDSDSVRLWINQAGRKLVYAGEISYAPQATAGNVRLADMMGSGTPGLVWSYPPRSFTSRNYKYLDFTAGQRPYLLRSIDDGTGLITEMEYRPSTEHAQQAAREGRAWKTVLPFPVQVVSRITARELLTGASTTQTLRYFDGWFDGASREFRGFGHAEVVDQGDAETPSTLTRSYFHQGAGSGDAWALTGKLLRIEVLGLDGSPSATRPFRVEDNEYATKLIEAGVDGARAVFPFLTQSHVSLFECGTTPLVSASRLFYDDLGNPIRKEDTWDTTGGQTQSLVTHMSYSADAAQWILNLPVELQRVDGGDGTLLGLTRYYYDGAPFTGLPLGQVDRGNLTRREELVLTDDLVTAVYGASPPDFLALGHHRMTGPGALQGWGIDAERSAYDAFGNLTGKMDPLGNSGSTSYGADHTYPNSVTDVMGHLLEVEYDPRAGQLRRLRDPNGHETRYHFDAVGRLSAMVKPGDSDALPTVQFEHLQDSYPLGVRTRLRQRSGEVATLDTVEYFDGFKQVMQKRSSAEQGRVLVDGFRKYDARGWESLHTAMFFSTGFAFVANEGASDPRVYRFHRDAMGRIIETVTPDGHRSRTVHEAGRTTVYDVSDTDASPENIARGHFDTPKVLEHDAQGRLLAVTEDTGSTQLTTRYSHDAMGRLIAVRDARGVEAARFRYDLVGRKLEVQHVDAGRRRVVFNARGDIALSTDAKGQQVAMDHDALRRLGAVRVGGTTVERYFYDSGTGANLVGRLARVEDEAGATSFSYTARGLVESRTREISTLSGTSAFTLGYAYDALDRMMRITYPGGESVGYHYNERSLVERIDKVIDTIEYNEFGQRTRVRHANGVEQVDEFDALTYYLMRSRVTGPTRPEAYRDVTSTYDASGNPLSMTDGVTVPGHARHQRQFQYDALFRLTRAEGSLDGNPFQHSFAYDGVGNFTRNEEFSPDPLVLVPGGSNQLLGTEQGGVQTPLFGHDANGNLVSSPQGTLEFDARGRLLRVLRNDGSVIEFAYDHQGSRVRKRVTSGGSTRETLYVDGLYEVSQGQGIRFVFHKEARVAALRQSGTCFFHDDHLGSVVLVTDESGGIVQELAYRAFGAVAFNSAADAPEFSFLSNPTDAETGLVYCQSRYYDPRLGRFVTPDPFLLLNPEKILSEPGSLNLYSYAGNNPVKLVDKEGAWWKWLVGALVIAALVVATVVVGVVTCGAGFAFGILLMASVGSALGAGIGTYSAWRRGGNLEDGFLAGALIGGAAGAAGYAAGAAVGLAGISGAWGAVLAGAAQGAVVGAGNGAIIGYAGGAGNWKDILTQMGVGALIGAVLGGVSGYVSSLSTQGGVLQPGTFEKALSTGTAKGVGQFGQQIQQTYSTGLAPVGQALDTGARSTLNSIIASTANPMVYASLGSIAHAGIYHDWDAIKAWILDTFGGESKEVIVNGPSVDWG